MRGGFSPGPGEPRRGTWISTIFSLFRKIIMQNLLCLLNSGCSSSSVVLLDLKSSILKEISSCPLGPKAALFRLAKFLLEALYSLFGDSENRGNNYLKIRDLLSIALFNILGTYYSIHIWVKVVKEKIQIIKKISIGPNTNFIRL